MWFVTDDRAVAAREEWKKGTPPAEIAPPKAAFLSLSGGVAVLDLTQASLSPGDCVLKVVQRPIPPPRASRRPLSDRGRTKLHQSGIADGVAELAELLAKLFTGKARFRVHDLASHFRPVPGMERIVILR
jgi:hypothetical protein